MVVIDFTTLQSYSLLLGKLLIWTLRVMHFVSLKAQVNISDMVDLGNCKCRTI